MQAVADSKCQPGATWQPFVVVVELPPTSRPVVRVVSNYLWCNKRAAHFATIAVVQDAAKLQTNAKLYAIDNTVGAKLMVVSPRHTTNPGGQLGFVDKQGKHGTMLAYLLPWFQLNHFAFLCLFILPSMRSYRFDVTSTSSMFDF
jgi:hypothetical protein